MRNCAGVLLLSQPIDMPLPLCFFVNSAVKPLLPLVLIALSACAVASEQNRPHFPASLPHYMPLPANLLLVAHAQESLSNGINYRYGGTDPYTGLDGGAFIGYLYQRTTGDQLPRTVTGIQAVSEAIPRNQMMPGDLVLFREGRRKVSHVGIYIGNQQFIHASHKYGVIKQASLTSSYWQPRFYGACRLPQHLQ